MGGSGSASLQDNNGESLKAELAVSSPLASVVELEATISHLKEKLNEVNSNYESVCDENERLSEALRSANNEVRRAEERAEEAMDAGTALEALLENERRHRREEADTRDIEEKEREERRRIDNDKREEGHSAQLKAERERAEGFRAERDELQERLAAVQQRALEAEAALTSSASTIEDMRMTAAALEKGNKEVSEELLSWRGRETKWDEERVSLEQAATTLQSLHKEAQGEVTTLKEQLKVMSADEEALKSKLSKLEKEVTLLHVSAARVPELTLEIETLQKGLSSAEEQFTSLTAEREAVIASLRSDKEALENKLIKGKEEKEVMAVALRQSEKDLNSLRQECLTAQELCADTQTKYDEVSSSLQTSREGSLHLSASICALETKVAALEEERRAEKERSAAMLEEQQTGAAALRKELKDAAAALRAKEAELKGSRGEYARLHTSYQSLEEKLSEARAETAAVREQLEQELTAGHKDEEHSIAVLTESNAVLQRELDNSREELERSREEYRAAQTDLSERTETIAALEGESKELSAQLVALQKASLEKVSSQICCILYRYIC